MGFVAKIVGAGVLAAGIKLVARLCGHRASWRLSLLIATVAVFSA